MHTLKYYFLFLRLLNTSSFKGTNFYSALLLLLQYNFNNLDMIRVNSFLFDKYIINQFI